MHVGSRIAGVLQHAQHAGVGELAPAQLPGPRAAVGAQREPAAGERGDHPVGRPGRGERGEHVPDGGLDPGIGIDHDTAGVAVSLDMDFVDPADAPGVGTPVRGGVTYREAHLAMEMIADSEAMVSLEVVEINPILDEHNRTALLGVELVLSGLGKKIL